MPLIIAFNSNISIQAIGKNDIEDQFVRAEKMARPLAEAFRNNKVIVLFYDETTPNELYAFLSHHYMTETLHKWGYGTEPSVPRIKGALYFKHTYAYPLVDDVKPICWNETPCVNQTNITVANLRNRLITSDRKCLFELPTSLNIYQNETLPVLEKAVVFIDTTKSYKTEPLLACQDKINSQSFNFLSDEPKTRITAICIIEINIPYNNAHPKLSTSKPGTRLLVNKINMALITNKNMPKVTMVNGKVKIIKIGRTIKFKIPSIKAITKAVRKLAICIPGNKYPDTIIIKLYRSHLISIFMKILTSTANSYTIAY